jgi:hypothetical protein
MTAPLAANLKRTFHLCSTLSADYDEVPLKRDFVLCLQGFIQIDPESLFLVVCSSVALTKKNFL